MDFLPEITDHDDVLMNVLVENRTLIGFLHSIFGFLARKTDFYVVRENDGNDGFPPGVAQEIVMRVIRNCDPLRVTKKSSEEIAEYSHLDPNIHPHLDPSAFMSTMVAEEVEVTTSVNHDHDYESNSTKVDSEDPTISTSNLTSNPTTDSDSTTCSKLSFNKHSQCDLNFDSLSINSSSTHPNTEEPKPHTPSSKQYSEKSESTSDQENNYQSLIASQKCSETYNGANRDNYCWSQSIGELDVTIKLPTEVTSSKSLKVEVTSDAMSIKYLSKTSEWTVLIVDKFIYKIKQGETVWIMSEGYVRIHLEKQSERWWNALFVSEPTIDTSKIDCSRPLHDLPDDHVEKVRELQWNHLQKLSGKPTSDEIKQREILKNAWQLEGSPFANTPYNPDILHLT